MPKIGYQDGITAFFDWYRAQPGVPQRGPGYDPDDLATWPWVDKMERTLRILKDAHDAAGDDGQPEPEPTPPPQKALAPQTYNRAAPARTRATARPGSSARVGSSSTVVAIATTTAGVALAADRVTLSRG